MAEDKTSVEQVKISELGLDAGFLENKNLLPDQTVSKDEIEKLKKENEDFVAKQKAETENAGESAPANGEKAAAEGISSSDEKAAGEEVKLVSGDIQVDKENDWVEKYEAILKGYAEANNQEWKREEKNEDGTAIEGLKGNIGEAKFHFTSEDKAIVNAEGINAIVALAKETGQDIAFNEGWSDEFKAKMLAACEAQGVIIQGRPDAEAEKTNEAPVAEKDLYAVKPDIARVTIKRMVLGCEGDGKYTADAIAKLQAEGAKIGDDSKQGAQLTMCEYATALSKNDTEKLQLLDGAMKRYGIQSIEREPDEEAGEIVVKGKDYKSYSDEEKAKIEESIQKLQPQERAAEGAENKNTNAAARQAAVAQRGTSLGE